MTKWITILLSIAGLAVAVYAIATATHEPPELPLEAPPSINPFEHGIAATGLVEAASRNIQIAAPEGGIVTAVHAAVGQAVKAGDPLFEIDSRPLRADLLRAEAARDAAAAAIARLEQLPRAEEIAPLEAAVAAARADVEDWSDRYTLRADAAESDAATAAEVRRVWFSREQARARLAEAEAQLALMRSGAWEADLEVARAALAESDASIEAVRLLLERRIVRSPIDGTVLKRSIEPGQFAAAGSGGGGGEAAMVVGDLSRLHIRAMIDEEDVPGLREGAAGQARIRGVRDGEAITVPLRMLRIEPLAGPKLSLSGSTTERVDTRVIEVVFVVEEAAPVPLFPGQLVDVFIEGAAR